MKSSQTSPNVYSQELYYRLVFSLVAKTLQGSSLESTDFSSTLAVFEQGLQLRKEMREVCQNAFLQAQTESASSLEIAQRLYDECCKRPHLLAKVLLGLLQICAKADTIPKQLDDRLREIADTFRFTPEIYSKLREHFVKGEISCEVQSNFDSQTATTEEQLLFVLGCRPGATNIEIRRAYRQLALSNHPDVYQSLNLDPKVRKDIEKRFTQIHSSYESLKKLRNIR